MKNIIKTDLIVHAFYIIKSVALTNEFVSMNGHMMLAKVLDQVLEDINLVVVILQQLGNLAEIETVQRDLNRLELSFVSILLGTTTTPVSALSRCLYFCANLSKAELKHSVLKQEYLHVLKAVEWQCKKYISTHDVVDRVSEEDEQSWVLSNVSRFSSCYKLESRQFHS